MVTSPGPSVHPGTVPAMTDTCGEQSHWRGITCQDAPHTEDRHNADDGRCLYTWTTASVQADRTGHSTACRCGC
jgi:hypothetical protein